MSLQADIERELQRIQAVAGRGLLQIDTASGRLEADLLAVDAVGWNYRFQTSLGVNGVVVDVEAGERSELGILKGDLLIRGSGDPSIGDE